MWIKTDTGYDFARMQQYAQYLGTHAQAKAKLSPALLVSCTDEVCLFFANISVYISVYILSIFSLCSV